MDGGADDALMNVGAGMEGMEGMEGREGWKEGRKGGKRRE